MNLQKITAAWKTVVVKLANQGIPVPLIMDPYTKKPSLPFTMVVLAIVLVAIGIVGKLNTLVGGVDKGSALQFLTTSAALYFGHSMVTSSTTSSSSKTQDTKLKTDDTNPGK